MNISSSYLLMDLIIKVYKLNPILVYRITIDAIVDEPLSITIYQWGTQEAITAMENIDISTITPTIITDTEELK